MAECASARILLNGCFYQIVSPINDSLHCSLCSNVLNNPHQTFCGCRFCLECIKKHLSSGSKMCPRGTSECIHIDIKGIQPDFAAKRDINKLVAQCPSENCGAEYEVLKIEEHFLDCRRNVNVSNYTAENRIRTSQLSCKYCGMILNKTLMETVHCNFEHVDVCKKYFDYCPNDCGEINKVLWKDHVRVCDANKLLCPYEKLGCTFQLRKTQMNTHLMEDSYKHTEILLKHVENLHNEITSLKMERNPLSQLASVSEDSQVDNSVITEEVEKIKTDIVNIKNQVIKCDEIERIRLMVQKLNVNMPHQRNLETLKSDIENIKTKLNFYNGHFLWQLTDFGEDDFSRNYSDTFYSEDMGYQMQLELNRCDEPGFLSIYAKLMRGNFDNQLEWPFTRRVTIRILDQERRNRNYVNEVDFGDAPHNCNKKPYKRYMEKYGIPRFISLNELDNKSYLYLDDEIWVDCFINDY